MKMKLNIIILLFILFLNLITSKLVSNLLNKKSHKSQKLQIFTNDDKKIIIEEHNKYRNQIALKTNKIGPKLPFATNMIQMYYSMEIHERAQKHADKKKFKHSSKKFREQPDFACGENVYMMMSKGRSPKKDWKRAIGVWFKEITRMKGKSVDKSAPGGTGHFTQLIWAHSYIIGCGHSQFTENGWITQLYVCQYGPVGNVWNRPIYKSSKSQTCNCDAGLVCENKDYPGLCCEKSKCKKSELDWSGKPYKGTVPKVNFD